MNNKVLSNMLGDDICTLINEHCAAKVIQCKWTRYSNYGHVRCKNWEILKRNLQRENMDKELSRYSGVRREWRNLSGQADWIQSTRIDFVNIEEECKEGFWGRGVYTNVQNF